MFVVILQVSLNFFYKELFLINCSLATSSLANTRSVHDNSNYIKHYYTVGLLYRLSMSSRVSHKNIEFFLFGTIFRQVPKKFEGFYFQKTVPVLEKVIVFGNRSIRQNFCFFSKKKNV